jgi:hypothetical protein
MTTNDEDGLPPTSETSTAPDPEAAPKVARRRRSATVPEASAIAPTGAAEVIEAPDIDEDGAWIEADAVEVHQGAVGRVDATEVSVSQGAIGAVKADSVEVHMGAVGAALGGHVTVGQGMAGTVLAQDAHVEQSIVRTLIARDVTVSRPSLIVFMIAQRVRGEIRVLLDWRGAIAFGAAFGALAGLVGRGRRRR